MLGDRGRLQRLRRAPRAPRRRDDRGLTRSDRRAPDLQAGAWAGSSRGRHRWIAISTTTSTRRSARSSRRSGSIDYNYSTLGTTPGSEAGSEGRQDRHRASLDFSGEFAGHDRHRHPHLHPRSARHERVRAPTASSTTPTPPTPAASTHSGECTSGSTGRRRGAMKQSRGFGGTTSAREILNSAGHTKNDLDDGDRAGAMNGTVMNLIGGSCYALGL